MEIFFFFFCGIPEKLQEKKTIDFSYHDSKSEMVGLKVTVIITMNCLLHKMVIFLLASESRNATKN